MNTYQIVLLSMCATFIVIYLIERITGISIFAKIKKQLPILQALQAMAHAVKGVYPSEYFDIAVNVLDAAITATRDAEDLWLANEIEKDQRSTYAHDAIAKMLKNADIEITKQVSDIIEGCIALTCLLMPHSEKQADTE